MKLPSVTQVIGPFVDWSQIPPDRLEAAADRGSRVHALCAAYLQDLWIPSIDEDCQGFFDSFRRWADSTITEVIAVEKRLTHPVYKFTGQIDFLGRIKGDSLLTLVDWKTPLAKSKSWRLQIASYRELASLEYEYVGRTASVRPCRNGGKAKFDEYSKSSAHDFSVFLNALSVYQFLKKE